MGSWKDEIFDIRAAKAVADALGITLEEFDQWVESDWPDTSDEGVPYGHVVNFRKDTPASVLGKVPGLDGLTVNLGPISFDVRDEDSEDSL